MASMTKEELKNSLISHGVKTPPSSAKKDEYVALYEKHVAPFEKQGDFSSDEEVQLNTSPRKKGSPKKSPRKSSQSSRSSTGSSKKGKKSPRSKPGGDDDVDIDALDDDELFDMLKQQGVVVGPILDSTRELYRKKLATILYGPVNGTADGFSDTDEEEEQPSGISSPSKASTSKNSPKKGSKAQLNVSPRGLRQRFAAALSPADEGDGSAARNSTPTPRRSIHTYKVTESTKQYVTRGLDGSLTTDTTHTVERSESKGRQGGGQSGWARAVKLLVWLLLIAGICVLIYYTYTNKYLDYFVGKVAEDAAGKRSSGTPPPSAAGGGRPPRQAAPDQGAVGGV